MATDSEVFNIVYQIHQVIILILAILLLYLNARWITKNKDRAINGVSILFVAIHTIVYYTFLLLSRYGYIYIAEQTQFFSRWSSIRTTHILLALITMECIRLQYTKLKQKDELTIGDK